MTAPGPDAALREEINLELRHLGQMVALLEEEQRDLVAGRTDRLEAIAAEKLVQARALDLYAERRARLLAARGLGPDARAAAGRAEAGGPHHGRLRELVDALAAAAAEARHLNAQNGALIRLRLATVDGRLAQLHGAGGAPAVYAADGRAHGLSSPRLLGEV